MGRKDDTLPYKVHACPIRTGATAGKVIDREQFENLLNLYYRSRGWSEDGTPPPASMRTSMPCRFTPPRQPSRLE